MFVLVGSHDGHWNSRIGILRVFLLMALHTIPIAQRPSQGRWLQAILFGVLFDLGCLSINLTQFLFLPLRFLPLPSARELYERGINYTKGCFGILCGELEYIGMQPRAF
jgi:hypothetical protein